MSRWTFEKWVGAGNDFIILDARAGLPAAGSELARRFCPRRISIGADGLILLTAGESRRISVDFYNADGSPAGFCGNGARCVAAWAFRRGFEGSPLTIVFPALTVIAQRSGDNMELILHRPVSAGPDLAVTVDGRTWSGRHFAAGVEHLVFPDPDPAAPLAPWAEQFFAQHPDLAGKVNLTFTTPQAPGRVLVRTFERGVGETLACGSGALAAAAALEDPPGGGLELEMIPPAQTPLRVRLIADADRATLTGEARRVYEGVVEWPAGGS